MSAQTSTRLSVRTPRRRPETRKQALNLRLDAHLIEKLKITAVATGKTASELVERWIRDDLKAVVIVRRTGHELGGPPEGQGSAAIAI